VLSKRRAPDAESAAKKMADKLGIRLHEIDISEEQLAIVKSPRFGHGSSVNPCLDCHILMARKAKALMEEIGGAFVATGEVLGQRPMSQHKQALQLVERESGLPGLLLRPLSAKLLEPTIPEHQDLVDRDRLLGIRGRSRKPQMALAAQYGITDYPTPAGGCILTEKSFGNRLRDLLEHDPDAGLDEVELLKCGRHMRLDGGVKVIVARDEEECRWLESHRGSMATFEAADFAGPSVLATPEIPLDRAQVVAAITASYGKGKNEDRVRVIWKDGETETIIAAKPINMNEISRWLIT